MNHSGKYIEINFKIKIPYTVASPLARELGGWMRSRYQIFALWETYSMGINSIGTSKC